MTLSSPSPADLPFVLTCDVKARPETLARLYDVLAGRLGSNVLVLDGGMRLFQPIDGVYRELGQLDGAEARDPSPALILSAVTRLTDLGIRYGDAEALDLAERLVSHFKVSDPS